MKSRTGDDEVIQRLATGTPNTTKDGGTKGECWCNWRTRTGSGRQLPEVPRTADGICLIKMASQKCKATYLGVFVLGWHIMGTIVISWLSLVFRKSKRSHNEKSESGREKAGTKWTPVVMAWIHSWGHWTDHLLALSCPQWMYHGRSFSCLDLTFQP